MARELFAGVMSGTSLDGVDAIVADFTPRSGKPCETLGAAHIAYPALLRDELLALQQPGNNELARAGAAANMLAELYSEAIARALAEAKIAPDDVKAAGVHGQTLRHRPDRGLTVQLNNAARVAEKARMAVVADFRSRDVAAGGQGAPLVPAFHAALFARRDRHRVIVNVGGIANITDLPPGGVVRGFDTGPGNVLSDLWCARNRGATFDAQGAWAATGTTNPALLEKLLADPYFSAPPPKSTHRDTFNLKWLEDRLRGSDGEAEDVQATLVALTARTIADAIRAYAPGADEILVCGGGANNATLMRALADELAPRKLRSTGDEGVPVEQVEPLAFAWLAREALAGRAGNLPAVTGAKGKRILGAIYPKERVRSANEKRGVRPASEPGRTAGSGGEARAAAAGRLRVRILDHELRAFEPFLIVDLGADEVLVAHRVDQQRDAALFHRGVVLVHDLVEREAVLEARAAATGHEHAQLEVGIAFLVDQRPYLGRRGVGEHQRARHLVHCVHCSTPCDPSSIIGRPAPRVKTDALIGSTAVANPRSG